MIYEGNHKLGDFFTSRRERGTPGLPMLSVTMNNGVVTRESLDRKMETNLSDEEHLLVRKDDIVYNMMRMWQGASGLADRDGLISPAYVVLAPKQGIDPLYASYLFKSSRLIYLLWAYSYGLTADRLRLYFNDFKRIPANIPDFPEQIKIGKAILACSKNLDVVEKLIENSKEQKKGLMQKLLTGSVRIPGFTTTTWQEFKLGQLFSERAESGRLDLPLVSITKELGAIWRDDVGRKDTSSEDKSKYLRICPGDIGYNTMRMWQGISAFSNIEGIVSPAYTIIIPKDNVDGLFMAYLFKMPKLIHDFYRYSQGLTSDTWNLKFRHFKQVKVTIPGIDEQKQIAKILQKCDQEVTALISMRDTLLNEKKALMQQLLTGKRRVKVDES
ncbi:restriction endonuclease subunit S [Methylobacter sp. YRD-M1]|uniref:restriction endonuclease subunit S n=1 Tax=Methylobacter sp. YRD-M1 TaxID=2911520 RepID=UPI00227CFD61|nr:restriction endonuclease subunit S [Methylobacter sp. YRD-M1]WAK04342.1 restriction endonuclease subunit S [Methylobacter sp. YRD-M1]